MHRILLPLLALAGAAPAADTPPALDAYVVVEAVIATHVADKGAGEVLMRYVLKDPSIEQLGNRMFVVGKTPAADHVLVPGSNWHLLMIPLDSVRVMGGATSPADFVTDKANAGKEPLGVPVAIAPPTAGP
jgi:hypothetical protein